ncbi:MAG: DUF6029 family protein [Crocinitomicaceae bacterium]
MAKKLLVLVLVVSPILWSQDNSKAPSITGNMETTFQYLNEDTLIGANRPASVGLLNSYMNVFYSQAGFKAGMRLESYLPRIQGYPNNFDGTGIGMRYVGYANDKVDVTLGHFYEQFGSGLSLRSYENSALGYDTALDGARIILRPAKGWMFKGVYGHNRYQFLEGRVVNSAGIVRGFDGELHFNEAFKKMKSFPLDISVGGSMVSKYQPDNNDQYILPENVASYGGRMKLRYKRFTLDGEYIHKDNDPSVDNGYIYNSGHAAVFNFGYSQKGLGILISGKSVDNMSFRSDRTQQLQNVLINYLPSLNKTHTYNLVAGLYPYATQPVGEIAYQAEVLYSIKKGSKLGGKYGTSINANYSVALRPMQHTNGFDPADSSRVMYKGKLFDSSDSLYWQDINFSISRKFTPKFNMILSYYNISLNNDVAKITTDAHGIINSHISVLEVGYKFNKKHSLRVEAQSLLTKKDKGDWATVVVEYTIAPGLFFSVMDQYNYGNPKSDLQIHYLIGTFGYVHEATRLTLSYGRQRAGLFCVGGVCRFVPASNGLTLNFTQSF